MNKSKIKESLIIPLKNTIDQFRSPPLAQFKSFDNVQNQWMRSEGIEMALRHVESVFDSIKEDLDHSNNVEIIPPK